LAALVLAALVDIPLEMKASLIFSYPAGIYLDFLVIVSHNGLCLNIIQILRKAVKTIMDIIDISISYRRNCGERRKPSFTKKGPLNINTNEIPVVNPFLVAINHSKHSGLLYRNAMGGIEKQGKPRYYPDLFE